MLEKVSGEKAANLKATMNWENKEILKRQVRNLKELGFTISLGIGCNLSPREKAFLKHENARDKG
ncbi:hypothetical protein [Halalkalibacter sp. APA_J-10(15)]|uniref:hypothetical protein n=1 Tax=Halalkalibacter sp. APA_J-10(15) TaxID=2933805 RepID=UPI001FF5A721|nr:hypothetical protein [Halalkalibacter sp. APA_J-10(15)]